MNKLRLLNLGILVIATLSGCEKYLGIDNPIDKLDAHSVFADSSSASSAVTGIYADMAFSNNGFIASQMRWAGLYANELVYSGSADAILQFSNNALSTDNSNNNSLWTNLYTHIYQANSVIEKTQKSDGIQPTAKDVLIGEARFIRAFLFLFGVNNWGDVPLTLSTDYRINETLARTSAERVYNQIVEDLTFAMQALPSDYLNNERTRPNKWAAAGLLARVFLYLNEWSKATDLAGQVIGANDQYRLSALEDTFLKESEETIWQIFPATLAIFNTFDGYYFVPSSLTNSTVPTYIIADDLYESFEPEDQRRMEWIGTKPAGPYYFPNKYKVRQATAKSEYNVFMRLSEMYLIRAEALAHQDEIGAAVRDLNLIRQKAGLTPIDSDLTSEEALALIEAERRHELFCEWGHRWYDLKRMGNVTSPTSANPLWPIPSQQLMTNNNLVQNADY